MRAFVQRLLARLADRLILCPTRHEIPTPGKTRYTIPFGEGLLEVWRETSVTQGDDQPGAYVLKFPGTAGRAERATVHPAECWPELRVEVWAVNPPGYGGSSGRARLRNTIPMARTVLDNIRRHAGPRPVIVTGTSLGCLSALYLAAHEQIDGLMLRNPPALREVIVGRFGWWNLRPGAGLIARQVPEQLCSIRNAARAAAPAIFVISEQDRIVPAKYQQQILDAYTGPKRALLLPDADHDTPVGQDQADQYLDLLQWLRDRFESDLGSPRGRVTGL
jgi:pimeloyl-ACP methyl ester carboxylesterase